MRVLQLLADAFRKSQHITDREFIAKLERRGNEYTVRRIENSSYVEVGRFCYRFNDHGQSRGGWINNLAADRMADWENWVALLNEPI
jgi:hypothetical protein